MPTPPRMIDHAGRSQSLDEWAAEIGITPNTLRSRLDKLAWPLEKALATQKDRRFARRGPRPEVHLPRQVPRLRRHARGQAYVRWHANGRYHDRYFGAWGSKEAADNYRRFVVEWAAKGEQAPLSKEGACVADLILSYMPTVSQYYRKNGVETSEVAGFRAALARLNAFCGDQPVSGFTTKSLKAYRETLIAEGLSRGTINRYVWRVVKAFEWAAEEGLVTTEQHALLALVKNLQRDRTAAHDPEPIGPVALDVVDATLPHLHVLPGPRAVLIAAVQVQRLTGMRSGELLAMRPVDLDRSRPAWLYDSRENKNAHHGKIRTVRIGPRAQAYLNPMLSECAKPEDNVFAYSRKRGGARMRISVSGYAHVIAKAAKKAGVEHWHPHQLRHLRTTEVQRRYESDADAAAAIGDTPEVARQVYSASPGDAAAYRIAMEMG